MLALELLQSSTNPSTWTWGVINVLYVCSTTNTNHVVASYSCYTVYSWLPAAVQHHACQADTLTYRISMMTDVQMKRTMTTQAILQPTVYRKKITMKHIKYPTGEKMFYTHLSEPTWKYQNLMWSFKWLIVITEKIWILKLPVATPNCL